MCLTSSMLLVNTKASQYNIIPSKYYVNVNISSPIQDQIYSNDVALSFSYTTNISNSTGYSVVFNYNLDGQGGFDVFGNPVFTGETNRIGEFYQPVPLTYNSSIHVSTGNHTLFAMVTIWLNINRQQQSVSNCSEIINFEVTAGGPISSLSPSPSPRPTSSIPEFPILSIIPLLIAILPFVFAIRKKSRKFD